MKNLWDNKEADQFTTEIAQRVYTSRLLGREPALVLHGGGNTSVKIRETNLVGEDEDVLYVKGSGWDLATIEEAGFSPVRMSHLLKLAQLPTLSDPQMVNELRTQMTRANAPTPSVETILHAVLPHKFVDHTHSDAIVAITNTPQGEERIREIFGGRVIIVPYVMPGFDLALIVNRLYQQHATERTQGMVLLNHGIFSFGSTAKESYCRMIDLVNLAEEYLAKNAKLPAKIAAVPKPPAENLRDDLAQLRLDISRAAGTPMILRKVSTAKAELFAQHPRVGTLSQQGPATPDHVIRTKSVPQLGTNVGDYCATYRVYFDRHAPDAREPKTMLDPAPRVVIDPRLGVLCAGFTGKDAQIVADIYDHTIDVILQADALGGYVALPERDLFDMEYWDLEQAKLKSGGNPAPLRGQVALVTGAASGIGLACAQALQKNGAAVVGFDIDPKINTLLKGNDALAIQGDVTDDQQIRNALEAAVRRFGGLDMLILNAGIFPGGCRIEDLSNTDWRKVMVVNVDSNLTWLREAHPLLKRSPMGARVVVIGSKNVPAPGPGAAAYSASKAALSQLTRVAALEWGADNIRLNTLHPNAVFDTGLWTDEVLNARAKHYGMSVDDYKRNNVLRTEVTSADVAQLALAMCGSAFAKTTGAQVPIDGGNDRVI